MKVEADAPAPAPALAPALATEPTLAPDPTTPSTCQSTVFPNETGAIRLAVSPEQLPTPDLAVLARMEEENKRIENDAKCASLTAAAALAAAAHARKDSDTSIFSVSSGSSSNEEADASKVSEGTTGGSGGSTGTGGGSEEELWERWAGLIANWDAEFKRHNGMVREMVRRGVPCHFRGIVWQLLAGAYNSPEKKQYVSYIKKKSACEKVIRRDIARTYPDHDFFKEKDGLGQESLFNVMKAYSLHDREVGYCQGSGFIVGLLLMQMPEEEAFAVLVKIMQQHRMRDMFKPSMAELGLCMFQLDSLLQELLPDLHLHFQAQNFSTSIYASSWFLTLFTTTLSLQLACRVMDVFLLDGIEIVFKVAIALLTLGQEELLALDMDNLLKYIQKQLPLKAEEEHDKFMALVYSVQYNPKKMKKLEKEYTVIKTKEQGDIAVQRCLRQENRLLKRRVEMLERESSELAERLVRGQVDRAEGEEESFALARELTALRRAHRDTQQRLALAHDEIRSLEMTIAEKNNSLEAEEEGAGADREELARCLQRELVRARLHAAEREAHERELTARIAELEDENKTLRRQRVDNNVAHLQDELIAVKMREAEANLSLKDLRLSVAELSDMWQKHLQQEHRSPGEAGAAAAPVPTGGVVSDIMATPKKLLRAWEGRAAAGDDAELLSARLREVEARAELKELRLKVMELETAVQVGTNQLRRQDDEARAAREQLEAAAARERVLAARLRDHHHKLSDLESKAKYDSMQANIRNVEDAQRIAELENLVSELKLKNEVMATEGELRGNIADDSDKVRELQEQVAELKAEVLRLEARQPAAPADANERRARILRSDNTFLVEEDPLEDRDKLELTFWREPPAPASPPPSPPSSPSPLKA